MQFNLINDKKYFIIEYINNENKNSDNPLVGYREEGDSPIIKLLDNRIKFDYIPKKIHPDILAFICIIIFYPFLSPEKDITFPTKVSQKLALELRQALPKELIVKNESIDYDLQPYIGKKGSILSFGGGIDSLALFSLFPNITLVHEALLNEDNTGIKTLIQKIDEYKDCNNNRKSYIIASNSKNITDPPGWPTWIACIATSLLLCSSLGISNIVLGSSMGSLPKSFTISPWKTLFKNAVNINIVTPILGLSELALVRLIDTRLLDYAIWCNKADNNDNCNKCVKCFRRSLLVADYYNDLAILDWSGFNNYNVNRMLRKVRQTLSQNIYDRELGLSLLYLLFKHKKHLPNWIKLYLMNNDNSYNIDFLSESWYQKSLLYVPESLQNYVYNRITEKVRIMSIEEIKIFETLTKIST